MDQVPHDTMAGQPTDAEVSAALETIVSSACFVRARRAQSFLRFVTLETLAGRAHAVNGYAIAIGVFGRPAGFDAANDPLVRVEARRLRSRLCEYYAAAGINDAVRIELKPGSYVPTFRYARPEPASVGLSGDLPRRRLRSAWFVGLPAAGLLAIAWAVGGIEQWTNSAWIGRSGNPSAIAQTGPRIRVYPFRAIETPDTAHLAFGMTEEVMTRLAAYRDLRILVGFNGVTDSKTPQQVRSAEVDADFELSGTVSTAADKIRVIPRLVDARSGADVWTAEYEEPLDVDSVWQVVDSVAAAVAAAVGEPYGPLFDAEVSRTGLATKTDPYHCLLRFVFALQVISEGAHGRATSCFEKAVETDPNSSMSWARLAALYRMEYLHAFNAKVGAPPALERAEDAARRALATDANNPFAHQEMAFLSLLRDDRAGFEDFVARTLELNPSADIRAALGINFIKMGEVERGLALIDQSIADSPRAPPFFFLGYVVQALRTRDYQSAYMSAQRMATRDWPLSQAMLAAVAALAGEEEQARGAAKRLLELRPTFATTGRDLIARGRLGADVESELFRGLALAGVALN